MTPNFRSSPVILTTKIEVLFVRIGRGVEFTVFSVEKVDFKEPFVLTSYLAYLCIKKVGLRIYNISLSF